MNALRRQVSLVLGHPALSIAVLLALWFVPASADRATVQLLSFVMINILLAQSINLLTGIAGQISLGHAGFFAIGAYGSAVLTKSAGLPVILAVPCAVALAALAGWLLAIPAGRVKEFYLAMMTAGFGLLTYEVLKEWTDVTGGVMGLSAVASPTLKNLVVLGVRLEALDYFRVLLVATAVVLWLLRNFVQSMHGRAFFAIQASEIAAGSIGIQPGGTKRRAYAISTAIAGLAGAFYAHLVGYLGPDSFTIQRSVEVLVMAIVGGIGTIVGPILGAMLFSWLPEKLQAFAAWQFMVYGLILMGVFLLFRKGFAGAIAEPARFVPARALRDVLAAQGSAGAATGSPGASAGTTASSASAATAPSTVTTTAADLDASPIVEVRDLTKRFAGLVALDGVSLALRPGRITALIGPNGSGKSTLVNVVSGIYTPSAGQVTLRGRDIGGRSNPEVAAAGLVRTFQDPRLVPSFTVRENVMLGAHLKHRGSMLAAALRTPAMMREERETIARAGEIMAIAGLTAVADQLLESLPYGYRRLAEVARALMADPEVLMLDEPAAGLSEGELGRLAEVIRWVRGRGKAVLLIEHHMDFVADLVDDVVVLDSGRVIYRGDMQGMRRDTAVIEAYLGVQTPRTADA
ncbi:MAG: branched-chain amino acid ABC transporter ATP-binding protein/permease [Burkholderiales bacterium]|nr:branched-chain amino acid ABC transporter ATP-binding protein/permease [Burkholderiales bacterium]